LFLFLCCDSTCFCSSLLPACLFTCLPLFFMYYYYLPSCYGAFLHLIMPLCLLQGAGTDMPHIYPAITSIYWVTMSCCTKIYYIYL
jgi:hypothetical protein